MKRESLFLKSLSDLPAYFPFPAPSAPEILILCDTTEQFLRQVRQILIEEQAIERISGIKGATFNANISVGKCSRKQTILVWGEAEENNLARRRSLLGCLVWILPFFPPPICKWLKNLSCVF